MTRQEILDVLKQGANFTLDADGWGHGAINACPECEGMSEQEYLYRHYPKKSQMLESLPWNIVEHPRAPKSGEYPTWNGKYITMLDCNEHEVLTNTYRNGNWTLYNCTHVKWWLKLPEE